MKRKNDFTLFITGVKENDKFVYDFVGDERDVIFFTLEYTQPHQKFLGIQQFQNMMRFQPFVNSTKVDKYIVIELSKWAECNRWEEEHLEIFFKFLHDFGNDSSFDYHYIILAGEKRADDIQGVYYLLSQYLYDGCINEKYVASNILKLQGYITKMERTEKEVPCQDKTETVFWQKLKNVSEEKIS